MVIRQCLACDGHLDDGVHRYELRVFFEDTDMAGVVYHANYIKWFERARSDLLGLLHIDQRESWESGEGVYIVRDLSIRYRAPARLGDAVMIVTRLDEIGGASMRLIQQAFRDKVLLAEAMVRVGFVGIDGRARRQPARWRDVFLAEIKRVSSSA